MDENIDEVEHQPGTDLSNFQLGLLLVGLVVAWFLIGLIYAVLYAFA